MDPEASKASRQSREFLECIVNAIPMPVFVKDRAHRFVVVNDALCRLVGRAADTLLGTVDREHFEPGLCDQLWEIDNRVLEGADELCATAEYTLSGGDARILRTCKRRLLDPASGEPFVLGSVSDVTDELRAQRSLEDARHQLERQVEARTAELLHANKELTREIEERRRAEETLRQTEVALQNMNQFLEGIVDNIYDPIFIKDESHRWIMINAAACELWGYSREELLGKSDYDFFPKEQADIFWEKDRRVLETGIDEVNEELLTDRQGRVHVLATKKSLFITSGGRRILVGIITDVTAQKQAEEELRAAKVQAEMANRAKSIFLANMSHEIRTPLNNILGLLDLLDLTEVTPEQQEYLRMARVSSRDVTRLINDVLDLSAMEAGRATLESVRFDLPELLTSVGRTFDVAAARKGLRLTCRWPEDLPRMVTGDPGRVRQVLSSLLGNAVKFTDQGEMALLVDCVEHTEQGARLRFTVRDTGIGITAADRDSIFNAFTQADSSTTKRYAGAGLGLYIVKVLIEMMGGTLGVRSEPGKGSEFWCEIPFPLAAAGGAQATGEAPERGCSEGVRILVAEDNEGTQFLLRALLAKLGYSNVVIVDDGLKAVDEVREESYDLILMDVQMPDMDGLEATRIIRDMETVRGVHTPIVACTAYALEEDRARCFEAGMDACVTKPLDARVLLDTVRRWTSPPPPRRT